MWKVRVFRAFVTLALLLTLLPVSALAWPADWPEEPVLSGVEGPALESQGQAVRLNLSDPIPTPPPPPDSAAPLTGLATGIAGEAPAAAPPATPPTSITPARPTTAPPGAYPSVSMTTAPPTTSSSPPSRPTPTGC